MTFVILTLRPVCDSQQCGEEINNEKVGVKSPLGWFPTFAFGLTYFLCNLALMFIFNA